MNLVSLLLKICRVMKCCKNSFSLVLKFVFIFNFDLGFPAVIISSFSQYFCLKVFYNNTFNAIFRQTVLTI